MTENDIVENTEYQGDAFEEEAPVQDGSTAAEASEASEVHEEDASPEDEVARYRKEIEALEAECEAANDRLLRTAAELKNFRRRAEEEQRRLVASTQARVIRPLLEVLDDFERTLEAAEQLHEEEDAAKAYRSLHEGVGLVFRKLQDELARLGVEPIGAVGEPFDENRHEALMQQPAEEGTPPGTVLREVQKGYRLKDRILRHSKVVVTA